MFTDIVGSSQLASDVGDRRWRMIQAHHNTVVRRELRGFGGREVDAAGDGFFATFETPADGMRCANAIVEGVRELGIEVRVGVHFGEAELTGEKVGGIAVHTAARVAAEAGPTEILVTGTIVDLVGGSGLQFEDRGTRELKGIPGEWHLFALTAVDGEPLPAPLEASEAAELRDRIDAFPDGRSLRASRRAGSRVTAILRGRQLEPWLIASAVAVAAVATILLLASQHRSPSTGEQGSQSVGPDATPTSRPLNSAERQLVALIPAGIGNTCEPAAQQPIGATASLECTSQIADFKDMQGNPLVVHVQYSQFFNSDDMNAAFDEGLHAVSVSPGDCSTDHEARGSYSIGGRKSGQVACFQSSDGSYIDWTDNRVLVYTSAYRTDLADEDLDVWWASAPGPVPPGSPFIGKDAPTFFPRVFNGTYTKTISNGPKAGSWKEVLNSGRYATFVDGTLEERGFYGLGKDHQWVIWAPTGPCAGVGFGVYRWRYLPNPSPGRIFLEFDFIRDACGGPPTEWSGGPPWLKVS
jgi:hypothetical protein